MSGISIHLVTSPTAAQLDEAVALCLRAYANDVAFHALTGGDKNIQDPLFRSDIRAGALEGSLYFALDNTNSEDAPRLAGLSIWFGPGRTLYCSEAQKNLGFYDFISRSPPRVQEWWKNIYATELEQFLDKMLGANGHTDSWYANNIAVDPDYQRRGIATMFIDVMFKRAGETGDVLALCAANELNATIYERAGFTRKGQMVMSSPSGDQQFPVICLARTPVPS